MIEARGLVKRYGATAAVNDLSFTIRPGLVPRAAARADRGAAGLPAQRPYLLRPRGDALSAMTATLGGVAPAAVLGLG
jgi:hypothetical protein